MGSVTPFHQAQIDRLTAISRPSWEESALLGCLERLRAGGLTEGGRVRVHDCWVITDGFCVVYTAPGGQDAGVRVIADGEQFQSAFTFDPTATDFGVDIADFTIGEPLGTRVGTLVPDEDGLGWWGDPPLPPAPKRR
ncbi:hypothetical protein [Herbiconiux ginsengi]|uniref:Uncharacterized protein n=1 Tax=Herbiconiux ginsengi TaxID=381665 RepID=A0A1H3N945_9MICO|nr:hypothetical protein [Herbiconiux ginsengi]SDY85368.1 hypothetical protein SAMN05216554_1750 [Herbiconiux ginsengi]